MSVGWAGIGTAICTENKSLVQLSISHFPIVFSKPYPPSAFCHSPLWPYPALGRGLRKVVKLQLRHFWLLRPHKSKQKCRLAIESEKREFKGQRGMAKREPQPEADPGANLNLTESCRWNCECQEFRFRIQDFGLKAHNYYTKGGKKCTWPL